MAVYATFADVETRAGRFAPLFTVAGKQPDEASVTGLLADVSGELAAAITSRGHDAAALSVSQLAALVDLTAYGALARALAAVPGDEVQELREYASSVWLAGLASVLDGSHVLIEVLESTGGSSAGSFWDDEPEYDPRSVTELDVPVSVAPAFAKGQTL